MVWVYYLDNGSDISTELLSVLIILQFYYKDFFLFFYFEAGTYCSNSINPSSDWESLDEEISS